jgi:gamma-glutamyltranspeptidase/glutathione hydrolase
MAPVIVLDQAGHPVAALGSPGGTAILAYNAKALIALLAWRLPLQQAIELPNLIARGTDYFGEATKFQPDIIAALAARGIQLRPGRGEESGLHGLVFGPAGVTDGGADPRRDGTRHRVSDRGCWHRGRDQGSTRDSPRPRGSDAACRPSALRRISCRSPYS